MARAFPADHKLQSFFAEQYGKEDRARLQFYVDSKRGGSSTSSLQRQNTSVRGLPTINPMQYARNIQKQERERLAQIIKQAQEKSSTEEMKSADPKLKGTLYTGFTKEGRGRYQYLKERHEETPEQKFTFPVCSSMVYGWKITGDPRFGKPAYARTRMIQDSFYTRNGVPDLGTIERSYTTL